MILDSTVLPPYVFKTHFEAENATRLLSRNGFDIAKLSIIGKGYQCEEHLVGFFYIARQNQALGNHWCFLGGTLGHAIFTSYFLFTRFWFDCHVWSFCQRIN